MADTTEIKAADYFKMLTAADRVIAKLIAERDEARALARCLKPSGVELRERLIRHYPWLVEKPPTIEDLVQIFADATDDAKG